MSAEGLAASFPYIIIALLLGLFGIIIGFRFGDECGHKTTSNKQFWKYNGYCYLVVIFATALFLAVDLVMLTFICVGFLGGFIAGIRMGFGESVGPWKAHDRFYAPRKKRKKQQKQQTQTQSADDTNTTHQTHSLGGAKTTHQVQEQGADATASTIQQHKGEENLE